MSETRPRKLQRQLPASDTSLGDNLRFRWEYQPGSELFVVYTDDYDSDPRPNVVSLRNRAFVVKFNRLFRYAQASAVRRARQLEITTRSRRERTVVWSALEITR